MFVIFIDYFVQPVIKNIVKSETDLRHTWEFLSARANFAHLVFTPTHKVASKTLKERNHTDAFCFTLL